MKPFPKACAGPADVIRRRMGPFIFFLVLTALSALLQPGNLDAQELPNDWPSVESRLRSLLAGSSEEKRTALYEIRNLGTEQASRLAVPALTDPDEIVRATAASSVIFLPEAEARDVLMPLLDEKKPFVRREAAYALGKVGNRGATNRLRRSLNDDRDPEVRTAAAIAIGKIGDPSAIDDMLNILNKRPKEEDDLLRRSAARAIGQIFKLQATGSTEVLTPQNFLSSEFKETEAGKDTAVQIPEPQLERTVVILSKVLRDRDEADDTRREAAFALGAMRRTESAAVLLTHLASPDPYLAEIIKEALLKIQNPN